MQKKNIIHETWIYFNKKLFGKQVVYQNKAHQTASEKKKLPPNILDVLDYPTHFSTYNKSIRI